jgi:tripartite-type tricarboxylate transporter receptor subunit TctC
MKMKTSTMQALCILVAGTVWSSGSEAQRAPAYPAKPVRVVVGLAPGGATDIQARWYSQIISESLGAQFIVDNRTGAGGIIAYELVAKAPPDGYTLLAATPSITLAAAFADKAPYDPVKDYAPVSMLTRAPNLVVVTPSFPAKTIPELIAYAKARPGQLLFGISGKGTSVHLGGAWLSFATGTRFNLVPYKGTGPVLTALVAGEVQTTFANVLSVLPFVKQGRLRAIAVTTLERSPVLPDLPTVVEGGVPGFEVSTWHGWLAPRGTPASVIKVLNEALAKAVKTPDIAKKLAEDGALPVATPPAELGRQIADEMVRWKKLIKDTGLTTN